MSDFTTTPPSDGTLATARDAANQPSSYSAEESLGAPKAAEPLATGLLITQQGSFDFAPAPSKQPAKGQTKTVAPAVSFNIQLCDAIEFMRKQPDASLDLIVTDPAYSGMNQKLKLGKGKIIGEYKQKGEEGKWFEEFHDTPENYVAFLRECYRVLKPNRHIYLMFDSYSLLTLATLIRDVFDVKNVVVWDKMHIGLGHYFRRRHEFILFASKGKRPLNSRSIPDVWRINRLARAPYPTQKPTELFEMMMIGSAEPGFKVCDPFMGSGASAIAALRQGCHFIGCDISPTSLRLVNERLETFQRSGLDPLQSGFVPSTDPAILSLLSRG